MAQTAMQIMYEELMCYEYTIPLELIVKCKELIEVEKEQMYLELPTDEEIEDNAKDYANLIGNKNGTSIFDYVRGAKWMRDKILNR